MITAILAQIREPIELFGIEMLDTEDFMELLVRFIFNLLVIGVIVRGLYYSICRRKDYLFSYILISMVVFFLCFLLENVKLQIGFALGLFAVFGIIRYRTNTIPIKEMTYLFLVIGVSVINALATKQISYVELIFTNIAIMALVYMLERVWLLEHEARKTIEYEKIDLIKPENRDQLYKDLRDRTGLNIHRVEIGRINFLRDTVRLRIYFMDANEHYFDEEDETGTSSRLDMD